MLLFKKEMSIFDDFDCTRGGRLGSASSNRSSQTMSLEQTLFNASSRGLCEKIKTILADEKKKDFLKLFNGFNAFHIAIKKGHIKVVELLLDSFPQYLTSRTNDNRNGEMIAAFEGFSTILELLFSKKAVSTDSIDSTECIDNEGNTVMHYACWGGRIECVLFLVERGKYTSTLKNNDSVLPIQFAVAGNHTEVVRYLLQRQQVDDTSDGSATGITTIHRACSHGALQSLQVIIDYLQQADSPHGVDIGEVLNNMVATNGSPAVHLAAQHGHLHIVQYLATFPSLRFDISNDYGLTALHYACIGYDRYYSPLFMNHSFSLLLVVIVIS
jgi:ankyrin repeat protein